MIKLTREQKTRLIEEVQHYFETERGETIGSIAAEALIDFMIPAVEPYLYNQALMDARRVISERFAAVEDELYSLEKPLQGNGRR